MLRIAVKRGEYIQMKEILLTADKLREIRWMTEKQIEEIYHEGKVPTKVEDRPEAYRQLRYMSPGQLYALFGPLETLERI